MVFLNPVDPDYVDLKQLPFSRHKETDSFIFPGSIEQ
jgi:hypothetical protein